MDVFLHIGSHKTGTTAIQTFASRHHKKLLSEGLCYASSEIGKKKPRRSHLRLVDELISNKGNIDKKNNPKKVLSKALTFARKNNANLLYSAESLFRLNPIEIVKFCKIFYSVFKHERIILVCGLRSQHDFANSLYRNQFRPYKNHPLEFRTWLDRRQEKFKYSKTIEKYTHLLNAECILLPYTNENAPDFIQLFFNRLLGRSIDVTEKIENANPSLNAIDCLAKKIVMQRFFDKNISEKFNSYVFENRIKCDYDFLDQAGLEKLSNAVYSDNQKLVELEPELIAALNNNFFLRSKPVDDDCVKLSEQRAKDFLSSL